uniref:Transmembrane protein n=1 Tax=Physcomitrium patens TaxID=3218 RepID=A9SEE2_PHYPA|nr:hypothetical protein PHYPA_016306 [Physcomitrium patens]
MRISTKVPTIALFCLALALSASARPQSRSSAVSNRLEDAEQVITTIVGTPAQGSQHVEHRFLKSGSSGGKESKSSKSSKRLKRKSTSIHSWSKATLVGVFIGVGVALGTVFVCFVFILVTEKKNTDPRWHIRYLLCGRKLKKRYSKAFSKKKCSSDEETADAKEREVEVSDAKVEVASSK